VARIFISHATEDDDTAGQVHDWLIEDGHETFLDHDVRAGIGLGEEWEQRLLERLRWADGVVCLVTSAYLTSAWCSAELGVARSLGSRLLPIRAEAGARHPLLPSFQYADLTTDARAARASLRQALRRVGATGSWTWPDGRAPFPGLAAFDAGLHRVFFGRDQEIGELAGLLRSPAERSRGAAIFLVGPSGCGKSSLVRGGLLPLMADEPDWWCLPPIIPGTDVVDALMKEIVPAARSVGLAPAKVRARIEAGELAQAADDMLFTAADQRRRLLVVVDQFEELLTRGDEATRARFAELMGPALSRSVQLVVTLRPEYLGTLLDSPELAALPKRVEAIHPLRREALRSVIAEPARLAGLHIDDELVDRLVTDTGDGTALPLLAYTLAQLSEEHGPGDRLLRSRYTQLNGVQGALVTQAGKALAEAEAVNGRNQDDVLRGLLRLVTVDERDQPARSRVPLAELPERTAAELQPFIDRRLLATDTTQDDRAVVGVAHEAFLSAWPPLRDAIARTARGLRARNDIDRAARQWDEDGEPASRLWEGAQLKAALAETGSRLERSELVSRVVELGPQARAFLRAGVRRRRRRWGITGLAAFVALALVATGFALVQQRADADRQRIATSRQLIAQAEAARSTDPRTALLLDIAAEHLASSPPARSGLVDTLTHTRYSRTLAHPTEVVSMAVSPHGRTLATGGIDNLVRLWDIHDPKRPVPIGAPLTGHASYVYSVEFAPDGATLVSASDDRTVILWDVSDPGRVHQRAEPLSGHTEAVHATAFAPGRPLLATAGFDGTAILWDVADPSRPRRIGTPLTAHTDKVAVVAFAPDGNTLATAGFDDDVVIWDVRDPSSPRQIGGPLTGHTSAVWAAAFSPDGRVLASGGADGKVILWDLADPAQPRGLPPLQAKRTGQVYAVAFSPDGHTVAAAGADKTVTLWDVTEPAAPVLRDELIGHTNSVYSVVFAGDGRTVASGGVDKEVILWDTAGPPQARRLASADSGGGTPLYSLAVAPDGRTVATAGAAGVVDLWDIGGTGQPQHLGEPLTGHFGGVWGVAFSPDTGTMMTGGDDGTVLVWDITDRTRPRRLGEPLTGPGGAVYALALSGDGRTLATAGGDRLIRLWDVSDPGRPRRVGNLPGHTGAVYSLALSPDGRTLASGGSENAVILWDVADPGGPRMLGSPLIGHTGPVNAVVFAAHGPRLASAGSDGAVIIWDVTDPAAPRALGRPLLGHTGAVDRVAFAADDRTLVSGGADTTAVLWDLTEGDQPRRLGGPMIGHSAAVNGVQFTPDTSRLATAGRDGLLVLWDLSELNDVRNRPVESACAVTGRGLSREEWAGYVPGLPYRETCPE
jgi:WD40 repeat protein